MPRRQSLLREGLYAGCTGCAFRFRAGRRPDFWLRPPRAQEPRTEGFLSLERAVAEEKSSFFSGRVLDVAN
ncbi:hypothetical protein B5F90_01220 [Alistipes sp. An31A]|nr:hypothetical protein B5F90_01220 [Alistipes sp. An31A]